ncbi:hypothetical protein M011DRAFT_113598 [Sporormia fimetaria CBS 119925]|uniref:Uncharacterized protein n=1 Tax=Sporormia fimetaria CBS 119925 TaxID=1340428 RepID=A0A6A6VQC2_9PLEO|nr:hypothetical protein M011DRAFT_113598 [Sporormia fimetaria CBS 119925]
MAPTASGQVLGAGAGAGGVCVFRPCIRSTTSRRRQKRKGEAEGEAQRSAKGWWGQELRGPHDLSTSAPSPLCAALSHIRQGRFQRRARGFACGSVEVHHFTLFLSPHLFHSTPNTAPYHGCNLPVSTTPAAARQTTCHRGCSHRIPPFCASSRCGVLFRVMCGGESVARLFHHHSLFLCVLKWPDETCRPASLFRYATTPSPRRLVTALEDTQCYGPPFAHVAATIASAMILKFRGLNLVRRAPPSVSFPRADFRVYPLTPIFKRRLMLQTQPSASAAPRHQTAVESQSHEEADAFALKQRIRAPCWTFVILSHAPRTNLETLQLC